MRDAQNMADISITEPHILKNKEETVALRQRCIVGIKTHYESNIDEFIVNYEVVDICFCPLYHRASLLQTLKQLSAMS